MLTLNTGSSSVELGHKVVKGAPLFLNGAQELAAGLFTATGALGGKVLPEKAVVDVTCAIPVCIVFSNLTSIYDLEHLPPPLNFKAF